MALIEEIKDKWIISNKFNNKQKKAIQYDKEKNVVVLAGAGSGKTSVFVERINYLVNKNVYKDKILALTFTEKAADEFKFRSNLNLKYFGTFHSVFYKLLQDNNFYDFSILDDDNNKYYLENIFNKLDFDSKEFVVKIGNTLDLDNFISSNLDLILISDSIDDFYELLYKKIIDKKYYTAENIVKKFFEYKLKDKKLNFQDIIIYTYFMIKSNREKFQNKFSYIMIDEFQDSNKIILEMLDMISNNNIFYVGDIYQSIYSFQGSSFKHTLDIIEKSNIIQLDVNYRSAKNIVDYANEFINNKVNEKIEIENIKDSGLVSNKNISIYENINDFTISELIYKSKDDLKDICILARNNNHLKEIKEHLKKWGVPYSYNNSRELEYILDSLLLMIVKNYKLEDEYFNRFNFTGIYSDNGILENIKTIEIILNEMNIVNYLSNRGYKNIDDRIDRWIEKQLKVFYSNYNLDLYLNTLKQKLDFYLDEKLYIKRTGVNVMTIHKSKGLEWNTVILYNFEDGIFPKNDTEEEKRLYYVAITRAKENLIITSKNKINSYTNTKKDYINTEIISKQKKYELLFNDDNLDEIKFDGTEELNKFVEYTEQEYKYNFKRNNRDIIIKDTINIFNNLKQDRIVRKINDYTIEDIENMIEDLQDFKTNMEIDNLDLQDIINSIKLDKKLFFDGDKINSDYINNDFTDLIHHIINYRNWIDENEINDVRHEERQIKKFKKIVRGFVSKKNTDLTKDRTKNYIQKREQNINVKHKNSKLSDNYNDFVDNMILNYHNKSNEQKQYFIFNVLGMKNNITNENMIDLTNEKYDSMKIDILSDLTYTDNGYKYNKEILKGKFLNDNKTIQAHKRWAKLKYLEHTNEDKRAFFMTLTLPSEWHKWKTRGDSLKEEREYGDNSYLEDNKKFILKGNNLEEHIINSAKKINEIWTYFYHILKIEIEHYKKRNKLDKIFEVSFFRQLEAHKNLISHGHFLIFVDEEVKSLMQLALHKTINEFALNEKFQDLQTILKKTDNEITDEEEKNIFLELMELKGKLDLETNKKKLKGLKNRIKKLERKFNNNFSSPASYIGKYMLKNAFRDEEDNLLNSKSLEFFNSWESMLGNKVKITGMSNYKITTQKHIDIMYKWYQENAPEKLLVIKKTGMSLYYWLEKEEKNGNFEFIYNRKIKENFKNSLFVNDIDFIFTMLKTDDLNSDMIQDKLSFYFEDDYIVSNFTSNSLYELSLNRNDSDKTLWEIATNIVLNSCDKERYKNIYTNKKLIGVKVSDKLVYKYSKTNYVRAIESYQYKLDNKHLSFLPTEWGFKWTSINGVWSLRDEVLFDVPKTKTYIYVEDMYSKGWLDIDNLIDNIEFDIYSTMKEYHSKIKTYSNYTNNIDNDLRGSFKDDPLDFLAS
jgi:DNA helicase-2/ATP-dependent DNA helicase PcrA